MFKKTGFLLILFSAIATPTYAATPTTESLELSINLVWVMLAAFLVFFMHAGFAMVESGFTRAKNSLNILMKNFLTISLATLLYFVIGFGLMFGTSAGGFFGIDGFLLRGRADIDFFVFQAVFAATCATIISGAVAERIKLSSYIIITIAMTAVIYPVVGHWVWNGGWLAQLGFVDFAGSSVVHLTGAVGALTVVLILGPRIGKYSGKKINAIPGHNIPLGALGVFILWLGWFGFNGGSTLAADPSLVPRVVAATLLSTSASLVAAAFYTKLRFNKIDPSLSLNGVLGGLVGITAGCANVSLGGSIIIGLVSGVILVEGIRFLETKAKIDDPVGAIGVHGICGIWGTLAVGLFDVAGGGGLFYGGGPDLFLTQLVGVVAVIVWTMLTVGSFTYAINKASSIRVSKEDEIAGLDFAEHGSNAYELKETLLTSETEPLYGKSIGSDLATRLNSLGKPS
ncbi:ammonium transporter [Virgibacillus necropolis]|uniref:Ammonium transporter n=1 Tax=Virgibacillus necropolis TaxID=163877 RepID=A0A221MFN4_9BACI|nr:ammonium transporter [Virgibacillus necropolis]ASN06457.1 ammonium transporter [Virgibacillus necropolis]